MANANDIKKDLAKVEKPKTLQTMVMEATKELGKALPKHLSAERIVRIALTSIRLNPELAKCSPESFLGSLFVLAQLGLEPIAGRSYLLPFNNKRCIAGKWETIKEVQAIVGYKGLIELFYRHESALSIDMQTVFVNDEFAYEYGTDSFIKHKPALKDRGEVLGYYAVAKMKGGASIFRFMSVQDALEHGKKHSKTWDSAKNAFSPFSPWAKEPDAMCMKTVLIQLMKLLPLSVEVQRALEVDETSRDFRKGITDLTDVKDTTAWDTPPDGEGAPAPDENVNTQTGEVTEKPVEPEIPFGKERK